MSFNPLKWVIPPQFRIAFAAAPYVAIALLAMAWLWQRADVVQANAGLDRAVAEKDRAVEMEGIAVASNKILTELVKKAADAERVRTRELLKINAAFERDRHANSTIPADQCYDGRLPDAAIRLYRYPRADAGAADAGAADTGLAGTEAHP
ncbi:hypothetical protein [Nevskia sp.]|uniref:hypothetical protein n=1 Tax=Nevskia sp. TaxID=1929292 RepID=UPI0025F9C81F|nr:hypothetical protein [Nevskia sp.]